MVLDLIETDALLNRPRRPRCLSSTVCPGSPSESLPNPSEMPESLPRGRDASRFRDLGSANGSTVESVVAVVVVEAS